MARSWLDQVKTFHMDARFRQRRWKQNGKAGKGEGGKKKKKAFAVAMRTRGRLRLSPDSIRASRVVSSPYVLVSRRRFAFETAEI
jgi:hypothetical protein